MISAVSRHWKGGRWPRAQFKMIALGVQFLYYINTKNYNILNNIDIKMIKMYNFTDIFIKYLIK